MIPAASFDILNETGYDIFSYFREYHNVENPHKAGKIIITAYSTFYPLGEYQRTTVDTLISDPGFGRWVSTHEENTYFTIDFLSNRINLVAYSLFTSQSQRFISNWDLYGIYKDQLYLLDERRNSPLCSAPSTITPGYCSIDDHVDFRIKQPGCFRKFRLIHRGLDSLNNKYLSLTSIKFYGSVNPLFKYPTCKKAKHVFVSLLLTYSFVLSPQ